MHACDHDYPCCCCWKWYGTAALHRTNLWRPGDTGVAETLPAVQQLLAQGQAPSVKNGTIATQSNICCRQEEGGPKHDGVPDKRVPQEPLHLGLCHHLLLRLHCAAGRHILVHLLPAQGEPSAAQAGAAVSRCPQGSPCASRQKLEYAFDVLAGRS